MVVGANLPVQSGISLGTTTFWPFTVTTIASAGGADGEPSAVELDPETSCRNEDADSRAMPDGG